MLALPLTASQCFFFTVLAFAVVGFYRGWKKEILSLLFVLIAAFLVHPSGDQSFAQALARIPTAIIYLLSGQTGSTTPASNAPSPLGPWGPLLAFILIAAIGYYVGEKAFSKPSTPTERILGILPAIGAAAIFLNFLNTSNFFAKDTQGHPVFSISLQPPDPGQFAMLLVLGILIVTGGLIMARVPKNILLRFSSNRTSAHAPSQPSSSNPPSNTAPQAVTNVKQLREEELQFSLFALARCSLESDNKAYIGHTYSVQAGISRRTFANFIALSFDVFVHNMHEPIQFDISLHTSSNIELTGDWQKYLNYDPQQTKPQFVEFPFQVVASGPCLLVVDFYREQHLLQTIRIEFEAIEQSTSATTTVEG